MDVLEETEMTAEETFLDEPLSEEEAEQPPRKKPFCIRPEAVMGIIAAFAAVLLVVMFLLCRPLMNPSEDPEALPERHEAAHAAQPEEETVQETILEPTVP